MKPYSPKPKGTQKGRTSLTSKSPTRSRALKRDKVAARRAGKTVQRAPEIADDEYSSSAGYGGWGHDE